MSEAVLLFSGGLDSFITWWLCGKPQSLYVRLGHRYEESEVATLAVLSDRFDIELAYDKRLHLGDVEAADAHIPLRNLLLALVAHLDYPSAGSIYVGALAGESSRDKSARFFRDTSSLLSYLTGRPVQVVAPFRNLTKAELVERYLENDGDPSALLLTRSCYSPALFPEGVQGCGQCMACYRRWVAMSCNGIEEQYLSDPSTWTGGTSVLAGWEHLRRADKRELWAIARNQLFAARARRWSSFW